MLLAVIINYTYDFIIFVGTYDKRGDFPNFISKCVLEEFDVRKIKIPLEQA